MKLMHDTLSLSSSVMLKEAPPFLFYHTSERRKQAMAFLEKVSNDYRLRDKIRIANNANDVVEIAKQSGFIFSTDEIWLYEDRTFKRKVGIRGWYTS